MNIYSRRATSTSRTSSPNASPKSARRSLNIDEHEYAYDFPMYTYVPSSSPAPTPSLPPAATTYTSIPSAFAHKPAGIMTPPPSSARFVHGGYGYANANSNTTPSRGRGPSFASTTSYASSSTACSTFSAGSSATSHSTASAVSPITPRSSYLLSTPTRTFKPYWERETTSLENEAGLRLDEAEEVKAGGEGNNEIVDEVEDEYEDEEFAYNGYGVEGNSSSTDYTRYMSYIAPSPLPSLTPSSLLTAIEQRKSRPRRSPFADNDPRAPNPYAHVYLNDEPYPARRSASLSSNREARGRRSESPRSLRSVTISRHASGSSVLDRSAAQRSSSVSSRSQDHEHTLSHELGINSPLDTKPDLGLDASPLRTALLLNPDSDAFEASSVSVQAERRFSGRGFGLGLGGMGLGLGGGDEVAAEFDGGGIKDEVERRRAEWTEFNGDTFSSSFNSLSMDSPSAKYSPTLAPGFSPGPISSLFLGQPPMRTQEADAVDLGSRYDLTSARPFSRSRMRGESPDRGMEVNLASPRTSLSRTCSGHEMHSSSSRPVSGVFKRLIPRGTSYVDATKADDGEQFDGAEKEVEENKEEEEENVAPKCLEVRWGIRERWASIKLGWRLGAFRARRRIGLA